MAISIDGLAGLVRKHITDTANLFRAQRTRLDRIEQRITPLLNRPRSIQEEIDAIKGRRIDFVFSGEVVFDAADEGQRGEPITIQVSQDGPFVMTHYPLFGWYPTAPDNTTNLRRWRPCSTWPLPDQVVDTDIIDILYEVQDGGNNRNFQQAPRGLVFSRPDNIVPLPVPTLFATAATIQVFPTYNAITFDSATPPTEGTLHCDLIGYRIVNM